MKWYLEPNHSESSVASHTITDDNNNVYFSGNFIGAIGFKKDGTYQLTGTNKNRPFVTKLDQNGNYVWSRKIEGDQINITSLNIDSLKNVPINWSSIASFTISFPAKIAGANINVCPPFRILTFLKR